MISIFNGTENKSYTYPAFPGVYKIECWGAKGSDCLERDNAIGGKGGYVSGYIKFHHFIRLYVYPGGEGEKGATDAPFNGGGKSQYHGGGGSDVRLIDGNWNDLKSLMSRIIVAGGGGASDSDSKNDDNGGAGGGLNGSASSFNHGKGGTQTHGGDGDGKGSFGQGGSNERYGASENGKDGNGAGGGGYFGGGASNNSVYYGGGGGSSFISGHKGCNAVDPSSTDPYNMTMLNREVHYSGYKFYNTEMYDGNSQMPKVDGGFETGHNSYGVVKITYLSPIAINSCSNNSFKNVFVFIFITFIKI